MASASKVWGNSVCPAPTRLALPPAQTGRLPHRERRPTGAGSFEGTGRGLGQIATVTQIVPVDAQRRTIGILIGEAWDSGLFQEWSGYQYRRCTGQCRTQRQKQPNVVPFYDNLGLGVDIRNDEWIDLLGPGACTTVIHVATGLQGKFARVVYRKAVSNGVPTRLAFGRKQFKLAIAHEDIVVEAVVASVDVAQSGQRRGVWLVVGRNPLQFLPDLDPPG